ncbi:MAG: hypothetical protein GY790_06120 [Bacteroidetes bacterium]|nr:hypothetical protein [Bacteroidota bacterium]
MSKQIMKLSQKYKLWVISIIVFGVSISIDGCKKFEPEKIFKVETNSVSENTPTTWTADATIVDLGTKGINQHGFVYAIERLPTKENNDGIVELGEPSSTGDYSQSIAELAPASNYSIRAFLTNSDSTTYGASLTFLTGSNVTGPSVITKPAQSVLQNSAILGGEVTNDGGASIIETGVFYGTSSDAIGTGTKLSIENSSGSYSTTVTGLLNGVEYYFVAYAVNSAGTSYGLTLNFETGQEYSEPSVSTNSADSIETNSAVVGGNVLNNGGSAVFERGIFYGESTDPANNGTKITVGDGTGEFSHTLTGLSDDTDYYFVAFATNSAGTSFGNVNSFLTGQAFVKPEVETSPPQSVMESSATVGGTVTRDGGATVFGRGIYYGISSDPVQEGTALPIGDGTGTFSTTLSGLSPSTRYYVVAYATNSAGPSYGKILNFSTTSTIEKPEVSTTTPSSVSENSATVGGNVTSDGGATVSEQGIYYGITSDLMQDGTIVPIEDGTVSFSTTLSGLSPSTHYYVIAYATNSAGDGFGLTKEFTTSDDPNTVVDRDGNVYRTVEIGQQTWMAENLKVKQYWDGTPIQYISDSISWDTGIDINDKAYCYYKFDPSNGDEYGALYTWAAAMNGAGSVDVSPSGVRGVCPSGWHLPSDREWKELEIELGLTPSEADDVGSRGSDEGGMLKEVGTSHWQDPNVGATDIKGFTALPAGKISGKGECDFIYEYTYWWSATQASSTSTWFRFLENLNAQIRRSYRDKDAGFSVRCVKD